MEVVDEEVERFDAIIAALREPMKNPAPRGKLILDPRHARLLHLNENEMSRSRIMDSTLSKTSEESSINASHFATPVRDDRKLTACQRREHLLERLRERQNEYNKFQQEMALGGHFDVFNDPYPEFKARVFLEEDSVTSTDDESYVEALEPPKATSDSQMSIEHINNEDEENMARSSQGRMGEGCSTPRCIANNTLAPLREIDVSAVTSSDAACDEASFDSHSKMKVAAMQIKGKKKATDPARDIVGNVALRNLADDKNDSMEDVLSRMSRTPKQTMPAVKTTTLIVPSAKKAINTIENDREEADLSTELSIPAKNNLTYSVHKDGTYNIHQVHSAESNGGCGGTFTIAPAKDATFIVQKQHNNISGNEQAMEADSVSDSSCAPEEQQIPSEAIFAVPMVPKRSSKNSSKITLEQREKRMNMSQNKNTSILEMMDVNISSPGRALFAARPAKKLRPLPKTPVRTKQTQKDDAMEVSIAMSDISQQPSIASDDSSMVDPVTDPRPAQVTPTRAPGFTRKLEDTPRSSLSYASTAAAYTSDATSVYACMDAKQKREIIKKSVERLSQPKHSNSKVCQRAEKQLGGSAPHSPYVGPMSTDAAIIEPVTPFEPIDPSRMIIPNADRSGTINRVPRIMKDTTFRMSLFGDEETPKPRHRNLMKRIGNYKPPKSTSEKVVSAPILAQEPEIGLNRLAESSVEITPVADVQSLNSIDESVIVLPPPPPTAADRSCLEALSPDGEMLLRATRSLSLEDGFPSGNNFSIRNEDDIASTLQQSHPQRLLADSICTLNTPHRAPSENPKRESYLSNSLEGAGDVLPNSTSSCSSEEDTVVVNDILEVRPHSRCLGKDQVMILKPRNVVHPTVSTPNVRRSKRNRMKPVREWLGEKPVYAVSPGEALTIFKFFGSKTLVGVNEVEVRDKRWLKVKTADYNIAQQREMQLAEQRRRFREKQKEEARRRKLAKIHELKCRHRKGEDLHTTVESIVTSSDEEEEDIEATMHVF